MSRVVVLKGGRSLERAVSLNSGARIEAALRRLGYDAVGLDVGADLVARLRDLKPEVAFVALHGAEGEDGTVQNLLELLGVPYTGSEPGACARSWDKIAAKHLLRRADIPTPEFHAVSQHALDQLGAAAALPELAARLGYPMIVKPARGGSSLGIQRVTDADALPGALIAALAYDDRVLIERYVKGSELAVGVLDGSPLPVIEALPAAGAEYDFSARYTIGDTAFVCPAELPPDVTQRAQEVAVATWDTLGCSGFARIDMIRSESDGELWVLEAEVVPGMTDTSLIPQAADAAGVPFDALVRRVVELADVSRFAPR